LLAADEVPKFDSEKYQDDKEEPATNEKGGNASKSLNTNEVIDKVITLTEANVFLQQKEHLYLLWLKKIIFPSANCSALMKI